MSPAKLSRAAALELPLPDRRCAAERPLRPLAEPRRKSLGQTRERDLWRCLAGLEARASGWQVVFLLWGKCCNCLSILSYEAFSPCRHRICSRGAQALESEPVEHLAGECNDLGIC